MKRKNTLFNWQLPINQWESGVINCSRELGGCGRKHSFNLEEGGEIAFDCSWENSKGQFECEKFADWLEEGAREEWKEEFKNLFLKEQENSEKLAQRRRKRAVQVASLRVGVPLSERQFDKELGGYQEVGYRKGKKEFFTCGSCRGELAGADKHGRAKNRNNPLFWGLEVEEKVLCLRCVKKKYEAALTWRKRGYLKDYLKRGYK